MMGDRLVNKNTTTTTQPIPYPYLFASSSINSLLLILYFCETNIHL